jgi:hypothetical protein
MRFKLKNEPKKEDIRTLTKFAWLPTFVDNVVREKNEKFIIWLETYYEEQVFHYEEGVGYDHPVLKWVTMEKYIV